MGKNPYTIATASGWPHTPPPGMTHEDKPPKSPSRFSKITRPILPTYHHVMNTVTRTPRSPPPASSKYSSGVRGDDDDDIERGNGKPKMQISGPISINPQFAHLVKPDHTNHPSNRPEFV